MAHSLICDLCARQNKFSPATKKLDVCETHAKLAPGQGKPKGNAPGTWRKVYEIMKQNPGKAYTATDLSEQVRASKSMVGVAYRHKRMPGVVKLGIGKSTKYVYKGKKGKS